MNNLILTLKLIDNIGNKTILKIINNMENKPKNELELHKLICEKANNDKKIKIPTIEEIRQAKLAAEEVLLKHKQENIYHVDILDVKFPQELKNIADCPTILFYKGNYNCLIKNKSIAIVGTRKPSNHGEKIAHRLGYLFAKEGYIITSGLALGCDQFAHMGCLDAEGRTVAVLGTSIDKISPLQNKEIAEKILLNDGCIVSENYIGEKTARHSFFKRNRIQSGLSLGVIIVETNTTGGTIETAKQTIEQNKILGVYIHPDKYRHTEAYRANRMLLNMYDAIGIKNRSDIHRYITTIENNKNIKAYNNLFEIMT